MSNRLISGWQQWLAQWTGAQNDVNGGDAEEVTALQTRRGRITSVELKGTVLVIRLAYVALWDGVRWWIDPANTGEGEITCDLRGAQQPNDQMATQGFIQFQTSTVRITIFSKRSAQLLTKPPVRPSR